MTATSQDTPDDKNPGLEPEKKPAGKKDDRTVPLGEHVEQRQELRAAHDKIAELERRLDAITKSEPAGREPQPSNDLAKSVADIQRRQRVSDLAEELGLGAREQAEAVMETMTKNPELDPFEALQIAQKRKPDIFKAAEGSGFQSGVHGSMRPRAGNPPPDSKPKKSEFERAQESILAAKTKGEKHARWQNLVGHLAAKAVGRPHTLDLPPES